MRKLVDAHRDGAVAVRDVSDAQFRQRWDSGNGGVAIERSGDQIEKLKLYDMVDGTWTNPIESSMVYGHYLRKEVVKCSACTYTSVYDRDVVNHAAKCGRGSTPIVMRRFSLQPPVSVPEVISNGAEPLTGAVEGTQTRRRRRRRGRGKRLVE